MSAYNIGLKVDLELVANSNDSTPAGLDFTAGGTVSYSAAGARIDDTGNITPGWLQHIYDSAFHIDATGWFGMVEVLFHSKAPNAALNQVIATLATSAGDDEWGLVYIHSSNQAYFFMTTDAGANYYGPLISMPADPTLTRHFFFFWIDPILQKVWLQRDDQSPVSDTYSGAISSFPTATMVVGADAHTLGTKGVDADIRRFRLWAGDCIAFSAGDISGLYNSGTGLSYASIVGSGIAPCAAPLQPASGWKFATGVGPDYF